MYFENTSNAINIPNMPHLVIDKKACKDSEFEQGNKDNDIAKISNNTEGNDEQKEIKKHQGRITISGRRIKLPTQFREEFDDLFVEQANNTLPRDEFMEIICVGAGIGEGILHTGELHVLKYKDE
jgi:hypothetical protein